RQRLAALELGAASIAAGMTDDQRRKLIVDLSKRYGILSKETTLIAIEHRSLEDRTTGKPAQRRVPVMLAKGWGGVHEGAAIMDCLMESGARAPMQAPASAAPAP